MAEVAHEPAARTPRPTRIGDALPRSYGAHVRCFLLMATASTTPSLCANSQGTDSDTMAVPDRTLCRESQNVGMTDDDALLERLRGAISEANAAPLTPVRAQNRLMTKVQRACDQLASTMAGRSALEWAAKHDPEPTIRLTAANAVARWDSVAGATALEALVRESGGQVIRPMTMTAALAVEWGTGRNAALCLLNLDRKPSQPERPPTMRGRRYPQRSWMPLSACTDLR